MARQPSASVTSASKVWAAPPSSSIMALVSSAESMRRSTTSTRAPSRA